MNRWQDEGGDKPRLVLSERALYGWLISMIVITLLIRVIFTR